MAIAHDDVWGADLRRQLIILGASAIAAMVAGGVALLASVRRANRAASACRPSEANSRQQPSAENMDELRASLARQTRQLSNLNKELEGFAHSVSHDLRAPLRAISGYAMIVEEDYGQVLDVKGQELLQVIRRNVGRMDALITDLISLSKAVSGEMSPEKFSMQKLVDDCIAALQQENEDVEFNVDSLEDVVGSRELIRQIWESLLNNAVKFSAKTEHPVIRVSSEATSEEVIYVVRDNGAGFDMRYGHKLFNAFQRLHRQEDFAGSGIGLALVQRIVARHGGRVWAEGSQGEGAAFYFALPRMLS